MKNNQISKDVPNPRYFMKHQTQNNTLYVTSFSRQLGRKGFESLFSQFGKINQICLFNSIKIAVPYGFVQYDDLRDAVTAKNQLQNKIINGLPLKIQYKKPKIARNQYRNQYSNNNQLPYYNEYPKFSPVNTPQNNLFLINPSSANKKQNQPNESTKINLSNLNEDNKKYQVKKQSNLQNKYVIPMQQIKIQQNKIKNQWIKLSQKSIISNKNQINQNNNTGQKNQINQLKIEQNNEQKKLLQNQKQNTVIQKQKQAQKSIEILMGSQNKNNINEGTVPQPFINKYYKTDRQRDRIKHSNRKSKSRNSSRSSNSNSSAQKSSETYKNYRRDSEYKKQRHRQRDRSRQRSKQTDKLKRRHRQYKHQHPRSRDKNRLVNSPQRQNYYLSHRQNHQKNYQRHPDNQQDKYRIQTNLKYGQQKRLNNIGYNYQPIHHPKLPRNLQKNPQFYKTAGSSIFQTIPLQNLQPNYWQLKSHISRLYRIIQSLANRVSDLQKCIEENSHPKKEHNIKLI